MTEPVQIVETLLTVEVTEAPNLFVEIEESSGATVTVELPPTVETIEVSIPGPAGPTGPRGEQGEVGPMGPSGFGDKYYQHTQNIPSDTWGPIEHNLGKYPAYGAKNSAGDYLELGIIHHDVNTATLTLSAADSGIAWFN